MDIYQEGFRDGYSACKKLMGRQPEEGSQRGK